MQILKYALGNQVCCLCEQASPSLLCRHCISAIPCFADANKNLMLHPKIYRGLDKVHFSNLRAIGPYQWPLSSLIQGLKFSQKIYASKALAELFLHAVCPANPQAIVPIPIHSSRYQERKYNQSIEVAKQLKKLTGVPIDNTVLRRAKPTQAQTELSAAKRRLNVKNAFQVTQTCQYQHIALLDDVLTTGATLDSAYCAMKKAFPRLRIDIWALAIKTL